ncbi:enoyl-CoA hydratase-related protein [Frankia sp. QA3]|uniref:enoyl-CoA hydratase-related protein n=1 Tax=Frankia sp. QA3 TaxID=710111 RepID=UPI00055FF8EB|nr:enoyl-CoA hydratase-related protein [Frankia sp. QA3]
MTDQDAQRVEVRREGHVLVVSMRRERRRNAVDRAMADALDAALNLLDDDDDLWVGVLTGTPTVFCAGSDLTAGGDYVTERGGEYGVVRRRRRKPLIAAVEGAALGGGLEIVLACDLVVAATDARFGLPEVTIGVVPTCGALFRGPRALPLNLARELILVGDPFDARRAHEAGLVNVLAEPGRALDAAVVLAERICRNAPSAVRACLAAVDAAVAPAADAADAAGWQATAAALDAIRDSADAAEGVRAFLEKRPPAWTGR